MFESLLADAPSASGANKARGRRAAYLLKDSNGSKKVVDCHLEGLLGVLIKDCFFSHHPGQVIEFPKPQFGVWVFSVLESKIHTALLQQKFPFGESSLEELEEAHIFLTTQNSVFLVMSWSVDYSKEPQDSELIKRGYSR